MLLPSRPKSESVLMSQTSILGTEFTSATATHPQSGSSPTSMDVLSTFYTGPEVLA